MSGSSKSLVPASPGTKQDDGSGNDKRKPTSPNTDTPKRNSGDKHQTDHASLARSRKSVCGRKEVEAGPGEDAARPKSHNQKETTDTPQAAFGLRDSSLDQTSSTPVRETPHSSVTLSTRTGRKEDKLDTEKKLSSDAKEAAPQRSRNQKKKNDSQRMYGHGEPSPAQASSAPVPESRVSSTTGAHGRQNK